MAGLKTPKLACDYKKKGWKGLCRINKVDLLAYQARLKEVVHSTQGWLACPASKGRRVKNKGWAQPEKMWVYHINSKYVNPLFLNIDLLSRRAVCNENCTYGLEEKYLPIKIIDYFFLHQRLRVRVPFLLYPLKKLEQVNFKMIPHIVWFSNINDIVWLRLFFHLLGGALQ